MNKDQMKGKMKDLAGKAQQKAGELTGSKEHQAKGLMKQGEGKVQETFGDAKQVVKKARDDKKR